MRIWDLPPEKLCGKHLLGEHSELHALWTILTQNKKGFSKHPETRRWKDKLGALYNRHEELVREMEKRGYRHKSPLDKKFAKGEKTQKDYVDSLEKQIKILQKKKCGCKVA